MQLLKIFTKLMSIDSQMHDLQPKQEPTPTTAEDRPHPQNDTIWSGRIIRDQKMLTLYKVMDMGA